MRATAFSVVLLFPLAANAFAQSNAEPAIPAAASAEPPSSVRAGFWWADYDHDGLDDAFAVGADGAARLLRNAGDGTFQDVTLLSGLDGLGASSFAAWQDFDRDGAPDLFVGTPAGPCHLMRNAGDGTFQDVTQFVGLEHSGPDLAAQWLDYDLDGLVDFAVRTDAGEHLYHALPNGHFEAVDLGRVQQLGESAHYASMEEVGAASRESEDSDQRKPAAKRGRRPASALPPTTGPGISPTGPSWILGGGNTLNIATCTDVIKNQATSNCISASSTPTLGWLYPLTINLNVSAAGNVGIGTTTPSAKFEVAGTARITDTLTLNPAGDQALDVSTGSIYKGGFLFAHSKGSFGNTAIGKEALASVTSGALDTASGEQALFLNTSGTGNTASGFAALFSNTSGNRNVALGVQALRNNAIGSNNTASGHQALYSNTTGDGNTASGYRALYANTTGHGNTASGSAALASNTTGSANTASGDRALASNTTGGANTASGYWALYKNTTGNFSTAFGVLALYSNTTGSKNTACGYRALVSNTTGSSNTASGDHALASNTTGFRNTASGYAALFSNTTGSFNAASGFQALHFNTTGSGNTANGYRALRFNTTGYLNTANGDGALYSNTTGNRSTANGSMALRFSTTGIRNTASGYRALQYNTTGSRNIALGEGAGRFLTTGDSNIAIGHYGVSGEGQTIWIGTAGAQTRTFIAGIRGATTSAANAIPVLVDSNGQLGTVSSSRRFKKDIRDMGDATARLLELRPVLFNYKQEQTMPDGSAVPPEYGLIAEEVAEIMPDLVVYGDDGKPFTVKYHILSSMLLNEMKKQAAELKDLRSELAVLHGHEARLAALESRFSAAEAAMAALPDSK